MKTKFALAALAAATISTFAMAQMGSGTGVGPGSGRGAGMAGVDCPMHQGMVGSQGKGGMHGGMHGGKGGGMHGGKGGGMHGGQGGGMHGGQGGGMHGGQGGGMHGGQGGGMMGMGQGIQPGVLATLGLTAEQQAKVTEIQREQQRKRHAMHGTMQEMRWKAQDTRMDGFNEDAARKQFDAMAAMRKEMFESGLAARKQLDAVLTPEQREKLKKARSGPGPKA